MYTLYVPIKNVTLGSSLGIMSCVMYRMSHDVVSSCYHHVYHDCIMSTPTLQCTTMYSTAQCTSVIFFFPFAPPIPIHPSLEHHRKLYLDEYTIFCLVIVFTNLCVDDSRTLRVSVPHHASSRNVLVPTCTALASGSSFQVVPLFCSIFLRRRTVMFFSHVSPGWWQLKFSLLSPWATLLDAT